MVKSNFLTLDQSANRGGRGGRGRGYGSPDAGGSRPAPEFHAPANFLPLSSLSPSASTFPPLASLSPSTSTSAASLSREFDKSLTLQSPSSAPVRRHPSDLVQPQPQTPALRPTKTHPTTTVPSQPQPQTPAHSAGPDSFYNSCSKSASASGCGFVFIFGTGNGD